MYDVAFVSRNTIYKAGSCVSFRRSDNSYGGAIIIESCFYKNNGRMSIVLTDINMNDRPMFENFLNSKMLNFEWEETYGGSDRFFAKINKKGEKVTGRISVSSCEYSNAKERNQYFDSCNNMFEIIGQLPLFIKILLSTSYVKGDILDYRFNKFENRSDELLKELTPLLSGEKQIN